MVRVAYSAPLAPVTAMAMLRRFVVFIVLVVFIGNQCT
jgi:hypothetical protein